MSQYIRYGTPRVGQAPTRPTYLVTAPTAPAAPSDSPPLPFVVTASPAVWQGTPTVVVLHGQDAQPAPPPTVPPNPTVARGVPLPQTTAAPFVARPPVPADTLPTVPTVVPAGQPQFAQPFVSVSAGRVPPPVVAPQTPVAPTVVGSQQPPAPVAPATVYRPLVDPTAAPQVPVEPVVTQGWQPPPPVATPFVSRPVVGPPPPPQPVTPTVVTAQPWPQPVSPAVVYRPLADPPPVVDHPAAPTVVGALTPPPGPGQSTIRYTRVDPAAAPPPDMPARPVVVTVGSVPAPGQVWVSRTVAGETRPPTPTVVTSSAKPVEVAAIITPQLGRWGAPPPILTRPATPTVFDLNRPPFHGSAVVRHGHGEQIGPRFGYATAGTAPTGPTARAGTATSGPTAMAGTATGGPTARAGTA